MNSEASWDSSRWRNDQYPFVYNASQSQPLTVAAPTAISPMSQSVLVGGSYAQNWQGRSRDEAESHNVGIRGRLPTTQSYSDGLSYQSRAIPRKSPPSTGGGNNEPRHLATQSPHQSGAATWRNSPTDPQRQHTGMSDRRAGDAPLTLHIPNSDPQAPSQDIPRLAPVRNATPHEPLSYGGPSGAGTPQATSLPSFASFRESASRPDEDEVEIAPMSSRLSCYQCTRLKSIVSEVATRVAELDDNIQAHCNRSVTRALDFPRDSTVRTAEWILSRLQTSKSDLQEASQRHHSANHGQPSYPETLSHRESPLLKRRVDGWDDASASKRFRPGDSPDSSQRAQPYLSIRDERRPSYDYATPGQSQARSGYSPPASESLPGSAYPRTTSPGRPGRALPSPTSVIFPPSAVPSLAPPTMGSPSTSYQNPPSNSPATAAHIADLQHQVSLRSLELQTLQSEYGSLLQKLQREKVKSQTIERKTNVADREVNDLTTKNEELVDQVKMLQKQLEESEKKRDDVSSDAKREKDQWSRMLEMSGRLQTRHAEEKQKLADENARLLQKLSTVGSTGDDNSQDAHRSTQLVSTASSAEQSARIPTSNDSNVLRKENELLKTRLEALRRAMEDAQALSQDVLGRVQDQSTHLGNALDEAFNSTPHNKQISTHLENVTASGTPPASLPNVASNYPNASAPRSGYEDSIKIAPSASRTFSGLDQSFETGHNNTIKTEQTSTKRNEGGRLFRPVNLPSSPFADAPGGHSESNRNSLHGSPGLFTDRSSPSNSGGSPEAPEISYLPRFHEEKGAPSLSLTAVYAANSSTHHLERSTFDTRQMHTTHGRWAAVAMPPPPARLV